MTHLPLDKQNILSYSFLDHIPFILHVVNNDGHIVFQNKYSQNIFGFIDQSKKCWEFVNTSSDQCDFCPLRDLPGDAKTCVNEVEVFINKRTYKLFHSEIPLNDNHKGMLEIFEDITDEKWIKEKTAQLNAKFKAAKELAEEKANNLTEATLQVTEANVQLQFAEEELKIRNQELLDYKHNLEEMVKERTTEAVKAKEIAEQANHAKSDFLANMSHELRTPIHSILSYAKFGEKRIDTADKQKLLSYFKEVRESGERLLLLVNDLLDLAKLESGKVVYNICKQDIIQLIRSCQREFDVIVKDKEISIDLSAPAHDCIAEMDNDKIMQVLRNLLSNAIKFSHPKGRIVISVLKEDKYFKISVADNGVGIPAGELNLVFDKFVQSSKTKTGAGGTGLGLAICKQIIEDHSGKILAEHNPQGGTILVFRIPMENKKKKLGEILLENGIITEKQLEEGLAHQKNFQNEKNDR